MKNYSFINRENNRYVDQTKLESLIQMVFEPLNEAELIRLSLVESKRTGYDPDHLFQMLSAHNQNNPKMMRSFYNKVFRSQDE